MKAINEAYGVLKNDRCDGITSYPERSSWAPSCAVTSTHGGMSEFRSLLERPVVFTGRSFSAFPGEISMIWFCGRSRSWPD